MIGDLERLFATYLYPLRVPIAIGLGVAIAGLVALAWRRGWFVAARRHPRRTGSVVALALVVGLPLTWDFASPLFIRTTLIEPPAAAVADLSTAVPGTSIGAIASTASTESTEEPKSSDRESSQPPPSASTATTDPAGSPSTDPSATQPGSTQPGLTRPAATRPAATQPGLTRPAATRPAATQPTPAPTNAPATPVPTPASNVFQPVIAASGTLHGADDFHFGEGSASIIETSPGRFTLRFEAFSVRNGPDLYVYLSPSSEG